MSAIGWPEIEDAIQAWVVASSGLDDAHVIWIDQMGPQPSLPYIGLAIDDTRGVGHDWKVYDDAPDPQPGADLRVKVQGHRTARLVVQCYGAPRQPPPAAAPSSPLKILTDVVAALELYVDDLDAAGAGIAGIPEDVQLFGGGSESILEPRAVTTVGLHLGSEVEGRTTYIERVQLTATDETNGIGGAMWIPSPPP